MPERGVSDSYLYSDSYLSHTHAGRQKQQQDGADERRNERQREGHAEPKDNGFAHPEGDANLSQFLQAAHGLGRKDSRRRGWNHNRGREPLDNSDSERE